MKQTEKKLLKGIALLLAAVLTFGTPVSALAAVPEADVTADADVTDLSAAADGTEAPDADEADADDAELSEEAKKILFNSMISRDAVIDDEAPELTDEILIRLGEGEETETPGEDSSETGAIPPVVKEVTEVKDTDFEAVRYKNRVTVRNKAANDGSDKDLFGVVVEKDEENKHIFVATRIPAGESRIFYSFYDSDYGEKAITGTGDYELWLTWVKDTGTYDDGEPDPFIGYSAQYDEETYIEKTDADGKVIYDVNIGKIYDLGQDKIAEDPKVSDVDWQDGADIKFKAFLQKNMTIKFTWAPDKQKAYKKYQLFELVPDRTNDLTGYAEGERIWPITGDSKSTKKSAVIKDGVLDKENRVNSSMIYLLKCYDASDSLTGQYVTTLAPYMFRLQSGYSTGTFDFMFTQSNSSNDFMYRMAIASQKKEYSTKAPKGFQDNWTSVVSNSYSEAYEEGDYPVNKKTNVQVLQCSYSNDEPEILLANQYFGRVQTVANVGKLQIASTPSNVLSCKAGPDKCIVYTDAGIRYDALDAKNKGNKENAARANAFMNHYFGDEGAELDQSIFIHNDNQSVDVKSGMIFFIGPDDESKIKAFDLLKCATKNGVYKKVKTYSLKDKALIKCKVDGWDDVNIYAMQYTNFPYEQQFFYAVRAVSTVKGVTGGLGLGHQVEPEFEKIGQAGAIDIDASSISVSWLHDDCVKEYWIYRSDSGTDVRGGNASEREYVGKVSGKSFKSETYDYEDEDGKTVKETIRYHKFTDTKIESNKWYFYYIRPVFNIKNAKADPSLYMDYCSEKYPAKASATFTAIKNFKVSNFATEKIKTSFTQAKNINEYRIWRVEVPKTQTKLTDAMKPDVFSKMKESQSYEEFVDDLANWTDKEWKDFFYSYGGWTPVVTYSTDGTSTKSYTSAAHDAEVGKYYFYLIQPVSDNANGKSVGAVFSYSSRIQNLPLPVENLNAKYTGSGVSLTWNLNANDKNNSNLNVQIKYDGAWHNASKGGYYDDSLPKGGQRTYYVRVRYGTTGYYSPEKSITYSLPVGIEVSKTGGDGEFKDNVLTLEYDQVNKTGQSANIGVRPYINNNETAAYSSVDWSYSTSVFEIEGSGNNRKIIAKNPGSATVTLTSAGVKKTFTVKVVLKKQQ